MRRIKYVKLYTFGFTKGEFTFHFVPGFSLHIDKWDFGGRSIYVRFGFLFWDFCLNIEID